MTVSINSKLLESGYGDKIHMLDVEEAMGRLRLDFRDLVREAANALRLRFSSRNETAAFLHPVSVIPVLYRTGGVVSTKRNKGAETEVQVQGMTLTGGVTVLAWGLLAEVEQVPAINMDEVPNSANLIQIATGNPEALWPAQFEIGRGK